MMEADTTDTLKMDSMDPMDVLKMNLENSLHSTGEEQRQEVWLTRGAGARLFSLYQEQLLEEASP